MFQMYIQLFHCFFKSFFHRVTHVDYIDMIYISNNVYIISCNKCLYIIYIFYEMFTPWIVILLFVSLV